MPTREARLRAEWSGPGIDTPQSIPAGLLGLFGTRLNEEAVP